MADDDPPPVADGLEAGSREDRIFTIPNVITMARLACLPVFLWLLFERDNRVAAAALLSILGATDFVDGYIARHYDQVSNLGKILDPVADRLLFFVAVTAIAIDGSVPWWVAILVLVREAAVAIVTVGIGLLGARRADVTWWGKAGTFSLMWAFPLFLLGNSTFRWAGFAEFCAWGFVIPGLVFSYVSWAMYVPIGIRALREGRADRAAAAAAAATSPRQ